MKVKELITLLQQAPEEAIVYVTKDRNSNDPEIEELDLVWLEVTNRIDPYRKRRIGDVLLAIY